MNNMLAAILKWFKDFFSGVFIEQDLDRFIKSKNPSTPEQIERLEKEFWRRKYRGREY